jgi:hypothetical protein
MSHVTGEYTTDDGAIVCTLDLSPDFFTLMGFSTPALGTPRRPQQLRLRREVFVNSLGKRVTPPYPTTSIPWSFGSTVTLYGDSTWMAIATTGEHNFAEST